MQRKNKVPVTAGRRVNVSMEPAQVFGSKRNSQPDRPQNFYSENQSLTIDSAIPSPKPEKPRESILVITKDQKMQRRQKSFELMKNIGGLRRKMVNPVQVKQFQMDQKRQSVQPTSEANTRRFKSVAISQQKPNKTREEELLDSMVTMANQLQEEIQLNDEGTLGKGLSSTDSAKSSDTHS